MQRWSRKNTLLGKLHVFQPKVRLMQYFFGGEVMMRQPAEVQHQKRVVGQVAKQVVCIF